MSDDLFKELLTSPLEDKVGHKAGRDRDRASGGVWSAGMGFVVAAMLGGLITIVGYIVARPQQPAVASTITSVSTTTTTTIRPNSGPGAGLPVGYTLVNDRLGIRPERILMHPGGAFITFSTAVTNTLDAEGTLGFHGGLWSMTLADGRRIESTSESFDPLARGTVSVFFPGDFDASDITAVDLTSTATQTSTPVVATSAPIGGLVEGETTEISLNPATFAVDAGLSIAVGPVVVSADGAEMPWKLESSARVAATVDFPVLTMNIPGGVVQGDTLVFNRVIMVARSQTGAASLLHPSVPSEALSTDGGIAYFDPPTAEGLPVGAPFEIEASFNIVWNIYTGASVTIPLQDVPIATMAD